MGKARRKRDSSTGSRGGRRRDKGRRLLEGEEGGRQRNAKEGRRWPVREKKDGLFARRERGGKRVR